MTRVTAVAAANVAYELIGLMALAVSADSGEIASQS